ncbi:IS200/IS605 family transposase [Candidatus Tisiphia endosymbiont of Dascillus cervinus]|uniref:IS200/IS605 family transposase n=1 Tax=Candidatus Tisiphia endosymbiont of Dascillus cervinus TaxID=3066253 RepID=UPI0039773230
MTTYESLNYSKWDCKYHIVFIPKCRKRELYGKVRKYLGNVFHELAFQRGSKIIEGHMVQDHVHMLIKIPPKYSVAEVIGKTYAMRKKMVHYVEYNLQMPRG